MDSPTPSRYPNRDGLPLSTLSPQRVNGRVARSNNNNMTATTASLSFSSPIRKNYDEGITPTFFSPGFPQSPSLPEFTAIRERFLPPTDVSGLVKRFEHLDVRDRDAESQERKRKYDEALDRAKIAREEAEDDARKSREELRAQRKELEESKDRERRACKRIDVLMDDFNRAKEQWSSQSGVYEKEVRRARKEAFKTSSTVLKLQEEHKHIISELRGTKSKLDLAQRKAIVSEEEKFAAQYQLVAVQEELEKLQTTLRIAQEEREALKKSLREDDIARIAAQGMIALPTAADDDEAPRTNRSDKADLPAMQSKDLERQLSMERKRRRAAQDLAEFMRHGGSNSRVNESVTIDGVYDHESPSPPLNMPAQRTPTYSTAMDCPIEADHDMQDTEHVQDHINIEDTEDCRSPREVFGTDVDVHERSVIISERLQTPGAEITTPLQYGSVRLTAKTMKVPINFSPNKKDQDTPINSSEAQQPGEHKTYTFDREAALAAIASRRGRTKSFVQSHGTPNRLLDDGMKDRRDVSAPVISG